MGLLGAPSPRPPLAYRLLLRTFGLVGRHILGLRLELIGAEHLPRTPSGSPAGGWIAMGVPHRTWIDPFVLTQLLPVEPRLIFLGDGRAIFRTPLRRAVFGRLGGVVPIWPGGGRRAFDAHLAASRSVIEAGAVFALFPETGPAVPVDRARPFGGGLGYFALHTEAPIVPLVLGGSHELYVGRRIRLVVLPPVSGRELAGIAPEAPLPPRGSADERAAVERIVKGIEALVADPVRQAYEAVEPPRNARKPLRILTRLFN